MAPAKELIARAIHDNGPRSSCPFITVDGGALAETLLESELFGHERGSFTGAISTRKGLLEKAHLGTCFLDEVADLSPALQGKLLRVIQEKEIRRVGSNASTMLDVRIIAASKTPLEPLVKAGTFREDLYYRMNVVTIDIPPLRERSEDIPLLSADVRSNIWSIQNTSRNGNFSRRHAATHSNIGGRAMFASWSMRLSEPWP